MGDGRALFSATVRRIEVHAGPSFEPEHDAEWRIHGHPIDAEKVMLIGYLRRSGAEGFGQAQVIGVLGESAWDAISASPESMSEFQSWAELYLAEVLYDEARRALQAQAALMDFQFDIALKAPPVEIELMTLEDESDEEEEEVDAGARP